MLGAIMNNGEVKPPTSTATPAATITVTPGSSSPTASSTTPAGGAAAGAAPSGGHEPPSARPLSVLLPGGTSLPPQQALLQLQQQFMEFQMNFAANPGSLTPEQFQAKMQMFQTQLAELQRQIALGGGPRPVSMAAPMARPVSMAAPTSAQTERPQSLGTSTQKKKKPKPTKTEHKSGPLLKLGGKKPFKKWQLRKCTITLDHGMEWHSIEVREKRPNL